MNLTAHSVQKGRGRQSALEFLPYPAELPGHRARSRPAGPQVRRRAGAGAFHHGTLAQRLSGQTAQGSAGRARRRACEGSIPCTGCRNCIPCPRNVAMGYLFNMVYNQYKADGDKARARRLVRRSMSPVQRGDRPQACDNCGACLPKCPQGINIPEALRKMRHELEI